MFNFLKNKKTIVTHDSGYHADDVFACAVISILEKGNVRIIRSRDQKIIERGDYVVDVGRIYDPSTNRFDHHQKEGAGKRENGIPYASFGLVWKEYGSQICGSEKIANQIDEYLVQPIDASDNGVDLCKPLFPNLIPYRVNEAIASFLPTWQESWDTRPAFDEALSWVIKILKREIIKAKSESEADKQIEEAYKNSTNKEILVLDKHYPVSDVLSSMPEVIYIVRPRGEDGATWGVKAVRKSSTSFENKKSLPASWGGLDNESLVKVSGVSDAVFCHKALFLAVAKSKEGAIKLAEIALKA